MSTIDLPQSHSLLPSSSSLLSELSPTTSCYSSTNCTAKLTEVPGSKLQTTHRDHRIVLWLECLTSVLGYLSTLAQRHGPGTDALKALLQFPTILSKIKELRLFYILKCPSIPYQLCSDLDVLIEHYVR